MDALTVAVDSLYREIKERPELERATVGKRIILVSNFLCAVRSQMAALCPFARSIALILTPAFIHLLGPLLHTLITVLGIGHGNAITAPPWLIWLW